MKVLITTQAISRPSGTSVFVRDLSEHLRRRGHAVVVFCCRRGIEPCWEGLDAVPMVDDVQTLPFMPDVIHAQHHDAMIALLALPGVPAVCHLHGANWLNPGFKHPRIYQYISMSQTLAERMAAECGIDLAAIELLFNAVDLQRFARVREPPTRPSKALVYNPLASPQTLTGRRIAEAAGRAGLQLAFIGRRVGRTIDKPEMALLDYDIVFASGKSAIDALACGCAVIVLGQTSCGAMVQPDNFDRLRRTNFSVAVNAAPPSVERIEAEIARYDPVMCRSMSRRLRREADLTRLVDRLEEIYVDVALRHRSARPNLQAERRAVSAYLRGLTPLVNLQDKLRGDKGPQILTAANARRDIEAQMAATANIETDTGTDTGLAR